ncbi:hypothetical protein R3P38DRAFT_3125370, partial [Favolaschia claudopus]
FLSGNLVSDSFRSAVHIGEVPCARNSLLAGIASGAAMHPDPIGIRGVLSPSLIGPPVFLNPTTEHRDYC